MRSHANPKVFFSTKRENIILTDHTY